MRAWMVDPVGVGLLGGFHFIAHVLEIGLFLTSRTGQPNPCPDCVCPGPVVQQQCPDVVTVGFHAVQRALDKCLDNEPRQRPQVSWGFWLGLIVGFVLASFLCVGFTVGAGVLRRAYHLVLDRRSAGSSEGSSPGTARLPVRSGSPVTPAKLRALAQA